MRKPLGLSLLVALAFGLSGCSKEAPTIGTGSNNFGGDGDGDDSGDGDDKGDGDGDDKGDGDGDDPLVEGECGTIEKTAELERGPVDIILGLDSSGSMAPGICNTSKELTEFADGVGENTHVAAVYTMTADPQAWAAAAVALGLCGSEDPLSKTDLAKDTKRYKHVNTYIASTDAFQVLLNNFDKYKGFLRPGAPTHFIVVTDDNILGMNAATFKTQMEAKLGHPFTYHAVANGTGGCPGNSAEHLALADLTKGKKLGLCSDFGPQFKDLEAAVQASAPLPCDFDIPVPPMGQELDIDNGVRVLYSETGAGKSEFGKAADMSQCGDKDGWFEVEDRIQFCPAACEKVKAGGTVAIGFGCAASPLL